MTKTIQIHDKQFAVSISAEKIQAEVARIGKQINQDLEGTHPLFLVILNGAFMFAADLMKQVSIPCEVSFVKLASYEGFFSSEKVKELIGMNEDLEDRTVVIVEDIVDTGHTMKQVVDNLREYNPRAIKIATFFHKPEAIKIPVHLDYVGMEIPTDFIVGYGLDYDGYGRNLADIYTLIQ